MSFFSSKHSPKQLTADQRVRDHQVFGEDGGVVPGAQVAATSTFINYPDMPATFEGKTGCHLYSRCANPTEVAFAQRLAIMNNMPAGIGVASGMAAINCATLSILLEKKHLIASRSVYGGTYVLFKNIYSKMGIETTFINDNDLAATEQAIRPETSAIYVETLSNPLLNFNDIGAFYRLAKKYGLKLIVDNTLGPYLFDIHDLCVQPEAAEDLIIVYSCTKYISGKSDMIAGAILGSADFIKKLRNPHNGLAMLFGPTMDANAAHSLLLRLDDLAIRMKAHSEQAQYLAECMQRDGIKVIYPGLPNHPQYDLITSLTQVKEYGYGGMLCLDCGHADKAIPLLQALQEAKFGLIAVSLGFSRTLMTIPSISTSCEIPEEEQAKTGLNNGMIRMSIGLSGNKQEMYRRFLDCYDRILNQT